jgi:AAA domain
MKTADEILCEHGIKPPPGKFSDDFYTTCPHCSASRSPAHREANCLHVKVTKDGVVWFCNHCPWKGGETFKANGRDRGREEFIAVYYYPDDNGVVKARKVRPRSGKPKCFWQHLDRRGEWVKTKGDAPRLLYRLPELREALANEHSVLIVEGEKDVDSAYRIGLPATCNPDGATGEKWRRADSEVLRGADIVIIPDHDEEGYKHANLIAQTSRGIAKRVRILTLAKHWPECPKGGDISDWLAAGHTREELDALIEGAPDHGRAEKNDYGQPLKLTFFDECSETAPKRWLIKNVIALGETSSWIAPPGRGKSALHSDICVHLAAEKEWRGHKTKGRFGCVYFAFERADLVKRRNAAYAKRYGLKGLPIAVAAEIIDLMHPDCVNVILATIHAAEERFRVPVGYIVIDTFAKGIAAGGGDEDKARDQNKCLTNLRRLHERADLHIAIVGHTGKDETKGSRGSNAHPADADLQVQIFGDGDKIKNARVIKGNDQPECELTAFALESANLGTDDDGDPITTVIVSDKTFGAQRATTPPGRLPKSAQTALRALNEAVAECGGPAPASDHIPAGVTVTTIDRWRQYAYLRGISPSGENPRAQQLAFQRASEHLVGVQAVGIWGDHVWAISK